MQSKFKRKICRKLFVLLLLVIAVAWFGWYKFLRAEPEQKWANESERFKYGSIGADLGRAAARFSRLDARPRRLQSLRSGLGRRP
jgi:hypothetical protein